MPPSPRDGLGQIRSPLQDSTTEPSGADGELVRVGAQIHQLLQLQAGFSGHPNQRYSPVYALPVELLSAIFLYTCALPSGSRDVDLEPFPEFIQQVTVLSSVSCHWRQVVFQLPELWGTVALEIHEGNVESSAALLQHCLGRAKATRNASVVVVLELHSRPKMKNRTRYYQPIADILFAPENAYLVDTLSLGSPPVGWLTRLSQLPGMNNLRLDNLGEDNAPLILDLRLQSLSCLSLAGPFQAESISLPSSLRVLSTEGIALDINLGLLRQCPNLVCCANWGPLFGLLRAVSMTGPLTLSSLTTLKWPASEGFGDIASAQNWHLPAIKHLDLTSHLFEPAMPVIIFCHQHSQTLQSLQLDSYSSWGASDIKQLLSHPLLFLEDLRLIRWPLNHLIEAVRALTPTDEEFVRNAVENLPRLKFLELTPFDLVPRALLPVSSRPSDDEVDLIELSLKMLERRRAGQLTPFKLYLPSLRSPDGEELAWSAQLRNRVANAVKGRRVKIFENDKPLECLP